MVRKKVEGDEDQRRAAALEAERAGQNPSAQGRTTGASKQRTHMPDRSTLTHEEKTAAIHRGKQGSRTSEPQPAADRGGKRTFQGRGHPDYTDAHEQVFRCLVSAQQEHGGQGVHLDEIAHAADRTPEETRPLLHDLIVTHRLVTELNGSGAPDLGPRYEAKPGH
ncbi:hypothetical protein [Streptomyces pristinaespiralis]|uniref:hypothetical protein n=1 Tax=Streptomyces pristinaespiralis TaxID=38300 RepID=UPI0033E24570